MDGQHLRTANQIHHPEVIKELQKVLEEVRPGAPRKASHVRIIARAARSIWNMTTGPGLRIKKTNGRIHIELA